MKSTGVICEYNPFHNGHLYQLKKIKEMYPEDIIIVVLNGYFLERGIVSLESKEEKTRLALKYGADIVIELPFVFGSNSADIFSFGALELLNALGVNRLVFGSESNNIDNLIKGAKNQLEDNFSDILKGYLDDGVNYPTAVAKASGVNIKDPNDILGISYIKTIISNEYDIEPICIKRTNNYHDIDSNDYIVSADNIRTKLKNKQNINKYIPEGKILSIDDDLLFKLLKYKVNTSTNLEELLTVDEGIDNKLRKEINKVNNIEDLIMKIKTKRYTYNRIRRMFIHILLNFSKEDRELLHSNEYIRLLGFSENGKKYISDTKEYFKLPLVTKVTNLDSKIFEYEIRAASLYQLLTDSNVLDFEYSNKPIKKEN